MVGFYIIAGNGKQARHWARNRNLKTIHYEYIHSYHQLLGLRKFKFIKVGTWYEHPEIDRIEERIKIAEGIEVSDPSVMLKEGK